MTALLAAELQSLETDEGEVVAIGSDLRVGLLVRAELGSPGPRWLLAFEAGCSPLRLRRPVHLDPDLPALPSWSVGLAIGAAWSVLLHAETCPDRAAEQTHLETLGAQPRDSHAGSAHELSLRRVRHRLLARAEVQSGRRSVGLRRWTR